MFNVLLLVWIPHWTRIFKVRWSDQRTIQLEHITIVEIVVESSVQ